MRYKSHIKSKHQFCSSECSYKGRSLGFVERIIKTPYECYRKTPRNCLICNKEFIYNGHFDQKYCSQKCAKIAHKENMKGVKNPAWIDGRSKNKRSYRGDNWEEIRKEVYKRDYWTCQNCFKHCDRHEIQAHHIIPYRISQNNSLDNLITLCNKCHVLIEYKKVELII